MKNLMMDIERLGPRSVIVRHESGCAFFSAGERDYERNQQNAIDQLAVLVRYAEWTRSRRLDK